MKLRMRFILVMAIFILSLTALATFISTHLLQSSSLTLEKELVREAIEGGRHFLLAEESKMSNVAKDWAAWDDTYAFMVDTNSAYIQGNLVDSTFLSLNLNVILYFDTAGNLVCHKSFDLNARAEKPAPPGFLEAVAALPLNAIREGRDAKPWSGLLPVGSDIWMLTAEPILTSLGKGPPRGMLVMARRLDTLSDWCPSRHWHGLFTLQRAPPGTEPLEIDAGSLGMITGQARLRDLTGAPSLILKTSIARRILQSEMAGEFFLTAWILLSGAAIGLFAFWLLDRWVLQDLSNSVEALKQGVSAVTARANLKLRLKAIPEGEMRELANGLNDMLTALDQAQQASEASRRELIQAQKMTALGTLVAGVAHEVNNPNAVIGLNLTALQRRMDLALDPEATPQDRARLKEDITALIAETGVATRRISAIASALKGFARPASEKMSDTINLNELVEKSCGLLKHNVAKAHCRMSLELADPAPRMRGNEQQLTQVLINLVDNACQASGKPDSQIDLLTENGADGKARITVRDQGSGVLPEHRDRIFEPFFTTRRNQGGTGLGLSISREIVQAHGGTIALKSVPGEGTEFTLEFPALAGKGAA